MVKIVEARVSEIIRNNSMLPRFKGDIERKFHGAKSLEPLRADLPILRVPLKLRTPFHCWDVRGCGDERLLCHLAKDCEVT